MKDHVIVKDEISLLCKLIDFLIFQLNQPNSLRDSTQRLPQPDLNTGVSNMADLVHKLRSTF